MLIPVGVLNLQGSQQLYKLNFCNQPLFILMSQLIQATVKENETVHV